MTPLTFKADSDEFRILRDWWSDLQNDRGARAELRRCATPNEAALVPTVNRLCLKFGVGAKYLPRIGALAALAAHIERIEVEDSLAEAMACGSDRPRLSEFRFRRLIQCQDLEELFTLLRRALVMLDRQANLQNLAYSLWFWPSDQTRQRWALDYYRKLSV